jgi:hypothetical protein
MQSKHDSTIHKTRNMREKQQEKRGRGERGGALSVSSGCERRRGRRIEFEGRQTAENNGSVPEARRGGVREELY